ncbi:MAG: hypothetical protein ACE5LU_03880 [Anaerolineae bacterium]
MVETRVLGDAGWGRYLQADPLPWLLEPANPSARYLTLRHVLNRPEDDSDVVEARAGILEAKPATAILAAQWPAGYWVTPDRGYTPRYRATVWQIMFLAQLGAPRSERIERACEFVWQHSRRGNGLFTPHKRPRLDDLVNLNGNLLWALAQFGHAGDPRIREVLDALAALDLGRLFGASNVAAIVKLAKGLQALPDDLPPALRSFPGDAAEFLAGHLPAEPDSQSPELAFPLAEETDLLEMLLVLGQMNAVVDSRVRSALSLVVSKQHQSGCWPLEAVPGKMWTSFGKLGQSDKWVTVRALQVLRASSGVT